MRLFSFFKNDKRNDLEPTVGQIRICHENRLVENMKVYRIKQFISSFNPALVALLPFWICFLLLFLFNKPELQEIDFLADRFDTFLSYFRQYWASK
jgi:hypothetical protein